MPTEELTEAPDDAEMSADAIDEAFVPRPRDHVAGVEIEGEAVLVVEGTTKLHWLNPIGTVVWGFFDGSTSLGEVVDELSAAFGAELDVVRNDVLELTRRMGRAGLLEGVAEEEAPHFVGPDALEPGTEVPSFQLPDAEGTPMSLEDLRGQPMLLVNWSPHCGFCGAIAPELAGLQPRFRERGVRLVFLSIGTAEENRELLEEHGLEPVLLLQDVEDTTVFGAMGTPAAYLLDEDGKVAAELALGSDQVPVLARRAAGLVKDEAAPTAD